MKFSDFSKGSDDYNDQTDAALRRLLDLGLIECEWDNDLEEFVFFMTDAQRDLAEAFFENQ